MALAGFGTVVRSVRVTTAENLNLPFALKVAGVQETIEVTGEVPLVDVKKRGTSTTMISDELQKMPNARDPWAVLKNVPGVVVDRVNIAGNNNGQQADAGGHGSMGTDKMWNLDGVTITDMSASGASPTYFDFDAFQEIAVTTGGADLSVGTGGLGINLVTKRGTNKFHGGGRFLFTDDATQSSNLPDALKTDPRLQNPDGTYRDKADHIDRIQDYGFDLGGPILKDKLWFYGTWGRQQVDIIALNGIPDKTKLTSYNAKLNWQATRNTMVSGFWFDGAKEKARPARRGSAACTGSTRRPSFLWNQGNLYEDNPLHGFWKLQVDQTFSPNFFVSAKVAYYNTGFTLAAAGGPDQSYTYDYAAGNAIGTYYHHRPDAPAEDPQRRRQLLLPGHGRQPRAEVRLRLPRGHVPDRDPLQRQRDRRQVRPRQRERRRQRAPRRVHEVRGPLPRLLRGRHLHEEALLRERRRALRPAEGQERRRPGPRQPRPPRRCCRPSVTPATATTSSTGRTGRPAWA